LFYEFHLRGKTFNGRGIGVPGSPIILIGFNERVAWGATALGADQADLFRLETDADHPDRYRFDGEWRAMTMRRETIRVKGAEPIDWMVRETHLGPVATTFCFAQPGEGEVALKRIPICETNRETVQAAFAMLRARNASEFRSALGGWRFPSANFVFGDRQGNIGYLAAGAIPVRARGTNGIGQYAMAGTRTGHDWLGMLPDRLLPQVRNPSAGYVYSGNHRPIESWYPLSLGASTGTGGDTLRSWRLRERLDQRARFTPEEVLQIHYDAVNPARRDIVRLALHAQGTRSQSLTAEAARALDELSGWFREGARSDFAVRGTALALELNTFFRFIATDLALVYGGGESGLSYFLKSATKRIHQDPMVVLAPLEIDYIDQSLATAWRQATGKYGPDPASWNGRALAAHRERVLGYYESLDGFPALGRGWDLEMPALEVIDGGTIRSQAAQSYTQWVPTNDPDLAQSILPIGISERPDHPARTSMLELWAAGRLHPAPLSRRAVERFASSHKVLLAGIPHTF
jgi:penicillin amidase